MIIDWDIKEVKEQIDKIVRCSRLVRHKPREEDSAKRLQFLC